MNVEPQDGRTLLARICHRLTARTASPRLHSRPPQLATELSLRDCIAVIHCMMVLVIIPFLRFLCCLLKKKKKELTPTHRPCPASTVAHIPRFLPLFLCSGLHHALSDWVIFHGIVSQHWPSVHFAIERCINYLLHSILYLSLITWRGPVVVVEISVVISDLGVSESVCAQLASSGLLPKPNLLINRLSNISSCQSTFVMAWSSEISIGSVLGFVR